MLSRLCLLLLASTITPFASADDRPTVLYLHTEFHPYRDAADGIYRGGMLREFVRQALLIAAREEMGIVARDATLGETIPSDANVVHLAILERALWKLGTGTWTVKLVEVDEQDLERGIDAARGLWDSKPIWEQDYEFVGFRRRFYKSAERNFGTASRNEFVEALESAGLKRIERQPHNNQSELPIQRWQESLQEVDFVRTFGVIREVHQAIAERGETPELLGLLVRGYAHLNLMTSHQWNQVCSAMAARSVLYAQRMLELTDNSDQAWLHRAYAWVVIGSHQYALESIAKLPDAMQSLDGDDQPAWVQLIHPMLDFDSDALERVATENKSLAAWARRHKFDIVKRYSIPTELIRNAESATEVAPMAYGVYSDVCTDGGNLTTGRWGGYGGPVAMAIYLPESLRSIQGIPQSVVEDLPPRNLKDPSRLIAPNRVFAPTPASAIVGLRKASADDASDIMAWSALIHLLREELFIQGLHRLQSDINAVESSHDEAIDDVHWNIGDHPYAMYIEVMRTRLTATLSSFRFRDPKWAMAAAWRIFRNTPEPMRSESRVPDYLNNDYTVHGLWMRQRFDRVLTHGKHARQWTKSWLDEFRVIAPRFEVVTRVDIATTDNPTLEQMEAWRKRLRRDFAAFGWLGQRYEQMATTAPELYENAIEAYENAIDLNPSFTTYANMDILFQNVGNDEKRIETLIASLGASSMGLDRANSEKKLADLLIKRGRWREARPHAFSAAQSYASWALEIGSTTAEGLSEWNASERFIRAMSESYPSGVGYTWYLWCCRTGRGNIRQARQLAEEYYASIDTPMRTDQLGLALYHFLGNRMEECQNRLLKYHAESRSTVSRLMLIQMSREIGDATAVEMITNESESRFDLQIEQVDDIDALELEILELIKSGDPSENRLSALDRGLRRVSRSANCPFCLIIGGELEHLKEFDLADKYLRRALINPVGHIYYRTMAGFRLAQRHGTSRPDNDSLDGQDL